MTMIRVLHDFSVNTSPEFKGIKTRWQKTRLSAGPAVNTSPEFKGIKTEGNCQFRIPYTVNTSPEFKGIKT